MATISGLRTEMVIDSCSQRKDSADNYVTKFKFIQPNHSAARNITLILQFEKQIKDVLFDTLGEVKDVYTTIADNKLGTSFQASSLAPNAAIIIKIVSRKPVQPTITGIMGQLVRKDK